MLRTNVEYIIGHSLGVAQSYYRPTEHELLKDYLKAIPFLSINDENAIDIQSLKEQTKVLEKKTQDKEKKLEELESTQRQTIQLIEQLQSKLSVMDGVMRFMNDYELLSEEQLKAIRRNYRDDHNNENKSEEKA